MHTPDTLCNIALAGLVANRFGERTDAMCNKWHTEPVRVCTPISPVNFHGSTYSSVVSSPRIVIVDDDDAIRYLVETVTKETIPTAKVTAHSSSLRVIQEVSTGLVDLLIT